MNHILEVNDQKFFTAQVVDAYERTIYDMTIIFLDPGEDCSPIVIDYYYGDPNPIITRNYIDKYFAEVNNHE